MAPRPPLSVSRARSYLEQPSVARVFRYAMVSVITTVVSLGGLFFFFRVAKIGSAAESNVFATAIATVPSYYLNRSWAWGKSGKSHLTREVLPFWTIAFVSLIISTGAVALAAHQAHHFTHSHTGVTLIVLGANFVTYGTLWIVKFLLFNRVLFKADPDVPEKLDQPVGDDAVQIQCVESSVTN